ATDKIEDLMRDLKLHFTIVVVTHNLQQAQRVSDVTAVMYLGRLVEVDQTVQIFRNPRQRETQAYILGRVGEQDVGTAGVGGSARSVLGRDPNGQSLVKKLRVPIEMEGEDSLQVFFPP